MTTAPTTRLPFAKACSYCKFWRATDPRTDHLFRVCELRAGQDFDTTYASDQCRGFSAAYNPKRGK